MSRDTTDTIVAVSSPPGRAYRGLIRVAGPATAAVLDALVGDWLRVIEHPRCLTPCMLRTPRVPALGVFFPGPHSYTGDDLAELQLPGNAALLDRLLHAATGAGARHAEPGEFTFRAFVNGRMDLTQAEGVAATVHAVSDAQLDAAAMLRDGKLAREARDMVDSLGAALALVEAGIDFVDQEDVVPIPAPQLHKRLSALCLRLERLLSRARSWGSVEALPRVVLVGPPSSGKSAVFNRLLGRDRAVIDAMPGTTRDALCEPLVVDLPSGGRTEVLLIDIAGLDAAEALLDREAQAAARRVLGSADVLVCFDSPPRDDKPVIRVQPKADLGGTGTGPGLPVSGFTGEGMDGLRAAIADAVAGQATSAAAEGLVLQPRHESALRAALAALAEARAFVCGVNADDRLADVELIARAMRAALDALAGLGGQLTPDDVIGKVFATFCIGK